MTPTSFRSSPDPGATPIVSTDVFPTLLEVAGLDPIVDVPLDGESLVPLLTGTADKT